MSKIPTAEEYLIEQKIANPLGETWRLNLSRDCYNFTEKEIQRALREFAKLHVKAALREANEIFKEKEPFEDNVLNVYPETNIK